jgi:methylated-DNA-protein-cysteine methyltransferase related protein
MKRTQFGKPASTFSDRVVALARAIPTGRVSTYGQIARAAGGGPMASQSITTILGKAYDRGITDIPFHRIVYADGRIWVDKSHRKARMKKYAEEGIEIDMHDRIKDFEEVCIDDSKELRTYAISK